MTLAKTPAEDYTDEPLYWFAVLDLAVEQGDHQAAAEAQRELERLGVSVRYGRPCREQRTRQPVTGKGASHAG
jgi:hypothetical protein